MAVEDTKYSSEEPVSSISVGVYLSKLAVGGRVRSMGGIEGRYHGVFWLWASPDKNLGGGSEE